MCALSAMARFLFFWVFWGTTWARLALRVNQMNQLYQPTFVVRPEEFHDHVKVITVFEKFYASTAFVFPSIHTDLMNHDIGNHFNASYLNKTLDFCTPTGSHMGMIPKRLQHELQTFVVICSDATSTLSDRKHFLTIFMLHAPFDTWDERSYAAAFQYTIDAYRKIGELAEERIGATLVPFNPSGGQTIIA